MQRLLLSGGETKRMGNTHLGHEEFLIDVGSSPTHGVEVGVKLGRYIADLQEEEKAGQC